MKKAEANFRLKACLRADLVIADLKTARVFRTPISRSACGNCLALLKMSAFVPLYMKYAKD